MANWSDRRPGATPYTAASAREGSAQYDAGLRSYMLSVYNYMASGVLLTGIVAMVFASTGLVMALINPQTGGLNVLGLVLAIAPLAIVFAMSFAQMRMRTSTIKALFWLYAVLMGASLSVIFLAYSQSSIAGAFFATAAGFAGLSLYGYTTKRDLSPLAAFFTIGLVGLIVAMFANMFIGSGPLGLVLSIVGVLLFAGLTAYDTQRTKSLYYQVAGSGMEDRVVVMSALSLYLDFINMFLFVLRMFGSSRS